jgi:predicted membrane channel-forming protein YqfA (hemolysin III family)
MANMLPSSVDIAFAATFKTFATFVSVVILFAILGMFAALLLAPNSLQARKFIHGMFVVVGCLVASRIV